MYLFRCRSPDELGSHMSTLKCQKCPEGLVMPDFKDEQMLDTKYFCNNCECEMEVSEVNKIEGEATEDIEKCYTNDADGLRQTLEKHKAKFHPQHYLILILKWLLFCIYGRDKKYALPILTRELLQASKISTMWIFQKFSVI